MALPAAEVSRYPLCLAPRCAGRSPVGAWSSCSHGHAGVGAWETACLLSVKCLYFFVLQFLLSDLTSVVFWNL